MSDMAGERGAVPCAGFEACRSVVEARVSRIIVWRRERACWSMQCWLVLE